MKALPSLLLVVALWPSAGHAWPSDVHARQVTLATKLMPRALRQQLKRHSDELVRGATAPALEATGHELNLNEGSGQLDADAAELADKIVGMIRDQAEFAAVVHELGRLGHLVSDAAYPLNTSTSDAREPRYNADFGGYVTSKMGRFPPIFNGFTSPVGFDVRSYVRKVAERANRRYPLVGAAYFPKADGPMRRSTAFDDRDPVFAVAQLSYIDGVTAVANVWLHVWREAHGDLSEMPTLEQVQQQRGPCATCPKSAAQRSR